MVKQWKLRVNCDKRSYEFLELEANGVERSRYDASDLGTIFDGTLIVFNNRFLLDGVDGEVTYFPKDQLGVDERVIINGFNWSVMVNKEGVTFVQGCEPEGMEKFAQELYEVIIGGNNV